MAFDQTGIEARGFREGVSLIVEWTSPAAAGTVFQIYADSALMWTGTARRAVLPLLTSANIDVGAVGAGESAADFSADLPAVPTDRARLEWTGGTFLSGTITGFNIYQSAVAGGAVSYAARVAFVPAYGASIATTDFGAGTFGGGAFGAPEANYSWLSPKLTGGSWTFGVKPVDLAENEGAAQETTVAIVAPPRPPAADAEGNRLAVVYDDSTGEATLTWLASPG
jgi:hypothetical protein